jgi:predicted RNase H-like HicB family nuclease
MPPRSAGIDRTIATPTDSTFSRLLAWNSRRSEMIELPYSLVIEATEEPDYFGFFSPDLEGFTGIGHSVEDCLYKAKWGMKEHVGLLRERGLPVPENNLDPKIVIQNAKEQAAS